jgi:polar amino acid transport system permease protein
MTHLVLTKRGSSLVVGEEVDSDDIVAVPLKHPWRWVIAAILVVAFAGLALSLWDNHNVDHPTIA